MPPCQSSLNEKVRRVSFVSHGWKKAHLPIPQKDSPEGYGWTTEEEKLKFKWYSCDQLPESVSNLLGNNGTNLSQSEDSSEDEPNLSSDSDGEF